MQFPSKDYKFIKVEKKHVDQLVHLHMENLSGDMTSLGEKVIRQFYNNCVNSDTVHIYMAIVKNKPGGFAVIDSSGKSIYRDNLVKNFSDKFKLITYANKWPLIFILFRKLFNRNEGLCEGAALIYLAIAKEFRNKGLGYELLSDTEEVIAKKGINDYHLHVKCSNVTAVNFYIKNGFKITDYISGRKLYILKKRLTNK